MMENQFCENNMKIQHTQTREKISEFSGRIVYPINFAEHNDKVYLHIRELSSTRSLNKFPVGLTNAPYSCPREQ